MEEDKNEGFAAPMYENEPELSSRKHAKLGSLTPNVYSAQKVPKTVAHSHTQRKLFQSGKTSQFIDQTNSNDPNNNIISSLNGKIKRSVSDSDLVSLAEDSNSNVNFLKVELEKRKITFWNYLQEEIFGSNSSLGGDLSPVAESSHEEDSDNYIEEVYNFIQVPIYLELILFGIVLCVDSFLFIFTYMPVRIIYGLLSLCISAITAPLTRLKNMFSKKSPRSRAANGEGDMNGTSSKELL